MNKTLLVSPLSILFLIIVTIVVRSSPVSASHFLSSTRFSQTAPATNTNRSSLTAEQAHLEEKILATTLRIEIRTWIIYVEGQGYSSLFSNGHGTVMNGRYLLTHNHFRLPLLELLADDLNGELATITLYTASGDLLWHGPLTTAAVAFDDSETLLLEFVDQSGQGLFESLGIPSAVFADEGTPQITSGATVAQVNWDNDQAYVQWTQVKNVFRDGVTPMIQLADCIISGSSGGGVFLNGVHIANNWSRSGGCVDAVEDQALLYSKAALNTAELLAAVRLRAEQ